MDGPTSDPNVDATAVEKGRKKKLMKKILAGTASKEQILAMMPEVIRQNRYES